MDGPSVKIEATSNLFDVSDNTFMSYYHLPKYLVRLLIDELLPLSSGKLSPIPMEIKVFATLNYFASGSCELHVGQDALNTLNHMQMKQVIQETSALIAKHLAEKYIVFPTTSGEISETKNSFQERFGFEGIIGCIDGVHIPIVDLETESKHMFVNKFGQHSLNVMLVCDSKSYITNVNANFPGSCHDSHVWRMSNLCVYMEDTYFDLHNDTYLIGDVNYPLQPWLMIPLQHPARENELLYDSMHNQVWSIVEHTVELLRYTFKCLKGIPFDPVTAGQVIVSCCILHNMLVLSKEEYVVVKTEKSQDMEDSNSPTASIKIRDMTRLAKLIRERIINSIQ